ncbi:cysteine hydrolase family protein [Alteromonas gracilis]|uniref:cysteine hydrolase family protein n=1 Tax=Alteromonas gracilis TaxID=1479524 RepID=UPI0037369EFA
MAKQALIVIDIQNDYFPEGKYPLHKPELAMQETLKAMAIAQEKHIPIIHIQHHVPVAAGEGLFFYEGSRGAEIHKDVMAAALDAPIITKQHADCFEKTNLEETLQSLGVEEILIAGMMTHNCVTHTALSPSAAKYTPKVIEPCTCTRDAIGHLLALDSMQVRGIEIVSIETAFS